MGARDHAIVLGISKYPHLSDLDGPENDACDFMEWLLHPRGGNVPQENIRLLLSSPAQTAGGPARPTMEELGEILDGVYGLGEHTANVGDRLYLYVAGHGFATENHRGAALFMANAKKGRLPSTHFPGYSYAQWFREAAFFKEVVLFMDCCRDHRLDTPMSPVRWNARRSRVPAKACFAQATQWGRATREIISTDSGEPRGLFTLALLRGLRANEHRRISGSDLETFVIEDVSKTRQLHEGEEPEFEVKRHADIWFNASVDEPPCNSGERSTHPTPPSYQVQVRLGKDDAQYSFALTQGGHQMLQGHRSRGKWTWDVGIGIYKVIRSDGRTEYVDVIGNQQVCDVEFK